MKGLSISHRIGENPDGKFALEVKIEGGEPSYFGPFDSRVEAEFFAEHELPARVREAVEEHYGADVKMEDITH